MKNQHILTFTTILLLHLINVVVNIDQKFDFEAVMLPEQRSPLTGPFDNATYQGQVANSKLEQLDGAVLANKNPAPWPSAFQQAQLFLEGMDKSFDFAGDDFPKQGPFNLETRKKLIHSVGSVVLVEYVAVNKTYSGAFQGCKNAFLRFSIAKEVNVNGGDDAMAPGIAYKCLRDHQPSGNIFAMYSLIGQSSYNFFAHDLSSHVPDLPFDAALSLQALRKKFSTASDYPPFLGKTGLAQYDESGKSQKLIFPFRLHFHPNTTLHNAIPDTYTGDEFYNQIAKVVSINQHLYSVYAQETPFSDKLTLIGHLFARSVPSTSNFGDVSLFFQHTRFETDLKTYPGWGQKAKDILAFQQSVSSPGFHYQDLPW